MKVELPRFAPPRYERHYLLFPPLPHHCTLFEGHFFERAQHSGSGCFLRGFLIKQPRVVSRGLLEYCISAVYFSVFDVQKIPVR